MIADVYGETLRARSHSDLRRVAYDYFASMEVIRFSYHHYPPIGAQDFRSSVTLVALGYPKGWVKKYVEERYFERDPIARVAASRTQPFWWSDIAKITQLEPREISYLRAVEPLGLGHGWIVPVFGPHARSGYYSIGFGETKPDLSAADQSAANWACQLFHLKYCELLKVSLTQPVDLSGRERSVLQLVARGYTNTEISTALNITSKTVATYISRSFMKLDVNDRMTAALRALDMGLLD